MGTLVLNKFEQYFSILKNISIISDECNKYSDEELHIALDVALRFISINDYYKKIIDYLMNKKSTTKNIYYKLLYYVFTNNPNDFDTFERLYISRIDTDNARYKLIKTLNSIGNLINDEYYTNAYDVVIKYLQQGNKIYFMTNLNMLSLPLTDAQLNTYYQMASLNEFTPKQKYLHDRLNTNRKLNLGFLSNDFFNRPSGQLCVKLIYHLKYKFNLYLFCHEPYVEDNFFRFFKVNCTEFVIMPNDCKESASIIKSKNIDILIDMKGRMISNNLDVFQYRPAPVQISWLAYPGSTGIAEMDYLIADKIVIPYEIQKDYSEKIIYFPDCYQINNDAQFCSPFDSNDNSSQKDFLSFVTTNDFVLTNYNYLSKLDQRTIKLYKSILDKFPNVRLVFLKTNECVIVKKIFEQYTHRIFFADVLEKTKHLYRIKMYSDISLDSIYCNSHTTASDVLFTGTPIVTLQGTSFAGRVCASLLNEIGCSELIAYDEQDYLSIIGKLISMGKSNLRLSKSHIKRNLLKSTLFNSYLYSIIFSDGVNMAYKNYLNDVREPIYLKCSEQYNYIYWVLSAVCSTKLFRIKLDIANHPIIRLIVDDNLIIVSTFESDVFVNQIHHCDIAISSKEDLVLTFECISISDHQWKVRINQHEFAPITIKSLKIGIMLPYVWEHSPDSSHIRALIE
jgi:predicted O-linked N-acetylglucosamine transferase (SPINDLY family)